MNDSDTVVTALYDYVAKDSDELSIWKGETLWVLESYDDGWMLARNEQNEGLIPSNYVAEINEIVSSVEKKGGNGHVNGTVKRSKPSAEIFELNTLRKEAEQKIDALSMAIQKTQVQEQKSPHLGSQSSPASAPTGHQKASKQIHSAASAENKNIPSTQLVQAPKQLIPKANLQQVALDPGSLKFISDIITERINHEFAVRDGRLMDRVKTMITSSTVPNTSITQRYEDRESGHPSASSMHTPQRFRSFSTSSRPNLGPSAQGMIAAEMSSSMLSKASQGSHPSRIPVRVHLPKLRAASESRLDPRPPVGHNPRTSSSARPLLGGDAATRHTPVKQEAAHLPPIHQQRLPPVGYRDDSGSGAPSPVHHHHHQAHATVIEPNAEGIQYSHCRSKVYGPSFPVDAPDPLPGAKLALHHVYGYDGDPNRHGSAVRGKNVLWADARRVIYPAAALVIVQEVYGDHRQGFFCGHSDDVTCVTVHPQSTVAASGQMGKDCCVLVWDIAKVKRGMSLNRNLMKLKPPPGMRGISAVDFSGDGRFLLAVGLDDSRLLIIYDWKEGTSVATAKIGHSDLNQVRFNPYMFTPLAAPTTAQSQAQTPKADAQCKSCYTLVSFGGKNIKFWTLKEYFTKDENALENLSSFKGRPLNRRKGEQSGSMKFVLEGSLGVLPNKNNNASEITSMVMINDSPNSNDFSRGLFQSTPTSRVFFGTSAGSIYIWQQLEDDHLRSSLEKVGSLAAAPMPCWQPKGKLLSVVVELHDSSIVDMDYCRILRTDEDEEDDTGPSSPDRNSTAGKIESATERIITTSTDGIVNVWQLSRHDSSHALPLEHMGYLELEKAHARTTSWDPTGNAAIIGTVENSVLLLSYAEEHVVPQQEQGRKVSTEDLVRPKVATEVIAQSHNGKVRKLALNAIIPSILATISTDRLVRVWDFKERVLLSSFEIADTATAITFSPSGTEITLGTEKGEILVYTCPSLVSLVQAYPCAFTVEDFFAAEWTVSFRRSLATKATTGQDGTPNKKKYTKKMEVCELKYSPAGDFLALACKDNLVHLLSVSNSYKHTAVCRGHSAHVRAIDFSADGALLQTADATRELMHWEIATGRRLLNSAQFRDAVWSTYNCVYGWSVQGVFNNSEGVAVADGDVNCVDRSPDARWLVSGGSHTVHNALKLFNYPCLQDAIPGLNGGHTSPVVDVRFLQAADGGLEVASAGGNDSCMFQWRLLEYK